MSAWHAITPFTALAHSIGTVATVWNAPPTSTASSALPADVPGTSLCLEAAPIRTSPQEACP